MRRHRLDPSILKAAVYGADDGIVTTFAVVSGAAGAGLSARVIIILGIANMVADGVSMGLGDFLGERSEQKFRRQEHLTYRKTRLWKTGFITFVAFISAGLLPLVPYGWPLIEGQPLNISWQFPLSMAATGTALFLVGSVRTIFTGGSWLRNGLEMLTVGAAAAAASYLIGAVVKNMIGQIP